MKNIEVTAFLNNAYGRGADFIVEELSSHVSRYSFKNNDGVYIAVGSDEYGGVYVTCNVHSLGRPFYCQEVAIRELSDVKWAIRMLKDNAKRYIR